MSKRKNLSDLIDNISNGKEVPGEYEIDTEEYTDNEDYHKEADEDGPELDAETNSVYTAIARYWNYHGNRALLVTELTEINN